MSERTKDIEAIMECMQTLRRALVTRVMEKTELSGEACKITPSQWEVVRVCAQKDGVSIKEIANGLSISSSAATQAVDALAKKGVVRREADADDLRSTLVRLHPDYGKDMAKMKTLMQKTFTDVFGALDDKELARYAAMSRKVTETNRKR